MEQDDHALEDDYKLVDLRDLHQSHGALNVYIYHGAASSTEAKEVSVGDKSYGAFTDAFVKHMREHNRSLDELSEMIRSEMTKAAAIDADCSEPSLRRQSSVQISPTENYLQHEFRGWCFHSSPLMCGGLVSAELENFLRRLLSMECFASGDSATETIETASETASIRSQLERGELASGRNNGSSVVEMEASPTHESRRKTIQSHAGVDQQVIWKEYSDPQGRVYYHNTVTKKTQWERPEELDGN